MGILRGSPGPMFYLPLGKFCFPIDISLIIHLPYPKFSLRDRSFPPLEEPKTLKKFLHDLTAPMSITQKDKGALNVKENAISVTIF